MSDNISANTVFHFTGSIDTLENILKNDFYPQFCFEDFFGTISKVSNTEKPIPMVCFCDIPLSQVREHTKKYGEYAIGLSKEWAIRKKINPVLYTYQNSDIANKLKEVLFALIEHGIASNPFIPKIEKNFVSAIQYVKPYEGRLWKNGQWNKGKIKFYNEREWRFIPPLNEKIPILMREEKPLDKDLPKEVKELNKAIIDRNDLHLSFTPKDIKFLIVKNEGEILSMHERATRIKRVKFPEKDVKILTTRIISMESIKENF